jgi:thioredoxin reductase
MQSGDTEVAIIGGGAAGIAAARPRLSIVSFSKPDPG